MQTDHANIIFSQIPVNFLVDAISDHLMERLTPLLPPLHPQSEKKKMERLITRKEAALTLRISLPTLDKWTIEGKLTGYRIARQIRYKESELLTSLAQMQ